MYIYMYICIFYSNPHESVLTWTMTQINESDCSDDKSDVQASKLNLLNLAGYRKADSTSTADGRYT